MCIKWLFKIKYNILENKLPELDLEETIKAIELLSKKRPQKEVEYKLFLINKYIENENYNKALEILEQNYLGETRQLKMQVLEKLERYEEIVNIIQNEFTEEEKNTHPILYGFLAEAFLNMKNGPAGIEAIKQARLDNKKMTDEICAVFYVLAKCYEATGNKTSALKQYNKVYTYNADYEDVKSKINELN